MCRVVPMYSGSVVISDYRTVHRGTTNRSPVPRPVAMLVYGREWWTDTVNYGAGDYGGAAAEHRGDRMLRHVEWKHAASAPNAHRGVKSCGPRHSAGDPSLTGDDSEGHVATAEEVRRFFWSCVTKWERGIAADLRKGNLD